MPVGAMWKHHIIVTRESVLSPPSALPQRNGQLPDNPPRANIPAVVAYIADPQILEDLTPNPDEVECIFDHPFGAIHRGSVAGDAVSDLVPLGSDWWPLEDEFHVSYLILCEADFSRWKSERDRWAPTKCM